MLAIALCGIILRMKIKNLIAVFAIISVSFFSGVIISNELNKPVNSIEIKPLVVDSSVLFKNVNDWRTSQGLAKYTENQLLCDQTSIRVFDIQSDLSHSKLHERFDNKYDIAENISFGLNEKDALAAWLASPSHKENLLSNYKNSCIRCIGNKCVELFANY